MIPFPVWTGGSRHQATQHCQLARVVVPLQLSTWDGVFRQTIFKNNTPTITNKGLAVVGWVCTRNHSTQEAEAVQLLWVPVQPGINNNIFFFLSKGNKWIDLSLVILKLHASGLVWGLELRSDHPKAWVLFVEETRAEQTLQSLREWQPQDFWGKRGSGAATNWPVLPLGEALWGRWGSCSQQSACLLNPFVSELQLSEHSSRNSSPFGGGERELT